MKRIFFLAIFSASCLALFAQNTDSRSIDSVDIQSNRIQSQYAQTNRNIQIITADDIKKLPVKSVPELLSYASGIDVRQRGPFGTQSDISIQGGTFEQTLILIDGVRMIDPQTGHNSMNIPVPLEAIERIEILKGAAARIYGLNALTGAINIVTKKSSGDFISGRLYAGSSFEKDTSNGNAYTNLGMAISTGIHKKKFNQILSLSNDRGNGFRHNTAYENYRLYAKGTYTINANNELIYQGGYINNVFGANAFYAAPGDKESKESVETATGSIKWNHQSGKTRIVPEISYRYNYDHYIYIQQKPEVYQNRHFTHSVSPGVHITHQTAFGQWALAAEHRYDNINSNNLGKRERNNTGISGEILYNKIKNFNILAGMYGYYNSAFGWGFFPGIEAGYVLKNGAKIFANAGSAQRIPSFTDLYYRGPSNVSNPNLRPENSRSAEIGFRKLGAHYFIQTTGFVRRINGLIDWVKDSISQPWTPVNYPNITQVLGLDVQGKLQVWKGSKSFGNANINLGYTWLKPAFVATEIQQAYSRYAFENLTQQIIGGISVQFLQNFQLGLQNRYLKRNSNNHYVVMDFHLQYSQKNSTFFMDITNLSNTQYREITSVPMPPRWIALGLRVNLNKNQ